MLVVIGQGRVYAIKNEQASYDRSDQCKRLKEWSSHSLNSFKSCVLSDTSLEFCMSPQCTFSVAAKQVSQTLIKLTTPVILYMIHTNLSN